MVLNPGSPNSRQHAAIGCLLSASCRGLEDGHISLAGQVLGGSPRRTGMTPFKRPSFRPFGRGNYPSWGDETLIMVGQPLTKWDDLSSVDESLHLQPVGWWSLFVVGFCAGFLRTSNSWKLKRIDSFLFLVEDFLEEVFCFWRYWFNLPWMIRCLFGYSNLASNSWHGGGFDDLTTG